MPLLRGLNEDEMRILTHKIKNSNRDKEDVNDQALWNDMAFKETEKKLAKLSEDENFNNKNRYRL